MKHTCDRDNQNQVMGGYYGHIIFKTCMLINQKLYLMLKSYCILVVKNITTCAKRLVSRLNYRDRAMHDNNGMTEKLISSLVMQKYFSQMNICVQVSIPMGTLAGQLCTDV